MTFLKFTWCCFVAYLVRITFDFDPIEFRAQERELVGNRLEIDRLRVAFVRAKDAITRLKKDAITLPSMPAAEPATLRSMRVAKPCEYLSVTPLGDDVEVPR